MPTPPFTLTPKILELSVEVGGVLGRLTGLAVLRPQPKLRRDNRIRTVQGTVAIEGNNLSAEQVTALMEGKRVLGPRREVREVQNAIAAYESAGKWRPWSRRDLLAAHATLMKDLLADAGRWRTGGVGVMRGQKVAHVAPPARQVPRLMAELLEWGAKGNEPLLIKACVLHYEIQFIHPFSDGNGRLGRLWEHVILLAVHPVFEFVPVESVIRRKQKDYYAVLGTSDRAGDCTVFVEFSLSATRDALHELLAESRPAPETAATRLQSARQTLGRKWFSRADYLQVHKRLSTATASRDLKEGVANGELTRRGDRRTALYAFKSR